MPSELVVAVFGGLAAALLALPLMAWTERLSTRAGLRSAGEPDVSGALDDDSGASPDPGDKMHGADPEEEGPPRTDAAFDVIPLPIWRQSSSGLVTWCNADYRRQLAERPPPEDGPATLFDPVLLGQAAASRTPRRMMSRPTRSGSRSWFDIHPSPLGEETVFVGVNADAVVESEAKLREFTQTLSKTFAHLQTGIAIFDRARRLALFNPALTDLTALPVDFLAARPTLTAFLDRLRDGRVIPEPKDYKSWRTRLAELEAAAVGGSYMETWSLPGGQTFRVTGQPHPDGAIIFLLEDITAEIGLTRQFRSELEMGQAVIDSLSDAVAVFTRSGVLAMSNRAYADLWGTDPSTGLEDPTVAEATVTWLGQTRANPAWGDFRDFVHGGHERAEWFADAEMLDGRQLSCRFVPIESGGTLASFSVLSEARSSVLSEHRRRA